MEKIENHGNKMRLMAQVHALYIYMYILNVAVTSLSNSLIYNIKINVRTFKPSRLDKNDI